MFVSNTGPTERFSFEFQKSNAGTPLPLILLGGNGSGKTNILSLVADALFEIAAKHFADVTPAQGLSRPWFRVVGGSTTRFGASGGVALLEFQDGSDVIFYKAKSGGVTADEIRPQVAESMRASLDWGPGNIKDVSVSAEKAKSIFRGGAYAYFPASRAESPNWLNRESLNKRDFDIATRFDTALNKPIFVERGLDELKQWLLALLIDIRSDYVPIVGTNGVQVYVAQAENSLTQLPLWAAMNDLLRVILGDPAARFVWAGRHTEGLIRIATKGTNIALDALSAGQATLLTIFGTILRYGDISRGTVLSENVEGICVIDEIDAHMHVELQTTVLPQLITKFPKVQFVVSSHSPLFALGVEKVLGVGGSVILEMPDGVQIDAETYREFGNAMQRFKETKAFQKAISESVSVGKKALVLLEGETDPIYLSTAAHVLGREGILEQLEFEWIGSKDPSSGQGYFTGKDALSDAFSFLRANPSIVNRKIVLLFDNDANKAEHSSEQLFVRSLKSNPENSVVRAGIENLLPGGAISDDEFDTKDSIKPNGTRTKVQVLNKMRLCTRVCDERNRDTFAKFGEVFDVLQAILENSDERG